MSYVKGSSQYRRSAARGGPTCRHGRRTAQGAIAKEKVRPSPPFGPDANDWKNVTINAYFDAAVAWARASAKGLPWANYVPSSNPWRRCAEILYAGKIYE